MTRPHGEDAQLAGRQKAARSLHARALPADKASLIRRLRTAAATGLIYPVWAMVAMAASVTTIFINSLWGRGVYFFEAIRGFAHPHTGALGAPVRPVRVVGLEKPTARSIARTEASSFRHS